jgi:hypothetical protein
VLAYESRLITPGDPHPRNSANRTDLAPLPWLRRAADDIDLSLPVGILVSAAIYLLMMRSRRTRPRRRTLPSVDSVHLHAAGPDGDSHVGHAFSAFLKAASAAGLSSSRQS